MTLHTTLFVNICRNSYFNFHQIQTIDQIDERLSWALTLETTYILIEVIINWTYFQNEHVKKYFRL
jgi:hypothetical protein